jgi:hypothetical protein
VGAVRDALCDPARSRAMGEAGARVAAEKFTLDRMLDQVEAVLFS